MGKKKFIDKKKSATFHLLARDTSDNSSDSDRIFVRVDNNQYSCPTIFEDADNFEQQNPDSIFADAEDDFDDDDVAKPLPQPLKLQISSKKFPGGSSLPDHVRREILELGLPDDGYNYLAHLREIKNAGGGSYYYENPKTELVRMPLDVKAYDASRVRVISGGSGDGGDKNGDFIYDVAASTRDVKVQRVIDPEVALLLDDSDLSRFGSDVEDLEEDFVAKANDRDDDEGDDVDGAEEEEVTAEEENDVCGVIGSVDKGLALQLQDEDGEGDDGQLRGSEKLRVRRLIDEQFDLLTRREYDSDSDYDCCEETEHDMLKIKLENSLKQFSLDDPKFQDELGGFGHDEFARVTELEASAEVIQKCVEYAEKYLNESDEEKVEYIEERSDESDHHDCESIISTYSNLDNHPGKIQAPGNPRKRIGKVFPGELVAKDNVITLRGKEKLPVEFLPHNKRETGKVKVEKNSVICKPKRKQHGVESKDEKKERKAAVKEERREARKEKKELKSLYKCESQRAQKVAAMAGPSAIPLS